MPLHMIFLGGVISAFSLFGVSLAACKSSARCAMRCFMAFPTRP